MGRYSQYGGMAQRRKTAQRFFKEVLFASFWPGPCSAIFQEKEEEKRKKDSRKYNCDDSLSKNWLAERVFEVGL